MKKSITVMISSVLLTGALTTTAFAAATSNESNTPVTVEQKVQNTSTYKWNRLKNIKSTTTQSVTNPMNATKVNSTSATNVSTENESFVQQVIDLTNEERMKAGLNPLATDNALMKNAQQKSQNMKDESYFSHQSPTLGSPFDQMKANGISYKAAGENIAKGQRTPAEVVQAWMDSPGHRANILDEKYTHIGVGYVASGNIWTQQFIKK